MPCQKTPIAVDDHRVLDERDEHHAEDAADDAPLAALEARAAEHGRGDHLQLDADAGVDHGAVQPRGAEHAGEPGEEAHDDEGESVIRSTRMPESCAARGLPPMK